MTRLSTLELSKSGLKFSAGHFTIFSATEREKLHGHNYTVYAALTTAIGDEGLNFDYRHYVQILKDICKEINHYFLLPSKSKFLEISEENDYYQVKFDKDVIPFLKKDAMLLPITNITVEELSNWFLTKLIDASQDLKKHAIQSITIKVSSSPGRSGSATWNS